MSVIPLLPYCCYMFKMKFFLCPQLISRRIWKLRPLFHSSQWERRDNHILKKMSQIFLVWMLGKSLALWQYWRISYWLSLHWNFLYISKTLQKNVGAYESQPPKASKSAFLHMDFGDFHSPPPLPPKVNLRVFQLHSLGLEMLYFYAPQLKVPFTLTVFVSLP